VTVLVDSGVMVRPSRVLWPLVPRPYVSLSPFDAHALGLVDGAAILLATERGRVPADLRVADGVTPGTVLAPRGLAWAVPLESLTGGERTASAWVEPAGG
jgi:anaerobic selenocysteine-containing dehydrogenase